MPALSYTVTEANGLRKYRCSACGMQLDLPLDDGPLDRFAEHVARTLMERHCRRECRGLRTAVKSAPT